MAIVELHNVKFNYPDKRMEFGSFDLSIEAGKIIFLMGANGSGKSTLLKLILGANLPNEGSVIIDGKEHPHVGWRSAKIAYVPQDKGLDAEMNADDIFDFIGSAFGLSGSQLSKKKDEICISLGIAQFKKKRIKYLSGGQRQLINIGMALLHDPKIILLDEPFVGLDYGSKSNVIALMRSLNKSVICITHDIDFAEGNADIILLLEKGKVLEFKNPSDLVQQHPYYIAELDFKPGDIPKVHLGEQIKSYTQFNRVILSASYNSENIDVISNYITANKNDIVSIKTFEQNLRSTLLGKYRMSLGEKKGRQKKKGKNK